MTPTTAVDDLLERNRRFADDEHTQLPPLPRLQTVVVTCPDPRVDPAQVLGLQLGDAGVVRAAAGRISPLVLQQLQFLSLTAAAAGLAAAGGVELVLMQHTGCGIVGLLDDHRDALAGFLGCTPDELPGRAVDDPRRAVMVDIDLLAGSTALPAAISVTGLVYDVATGRVELVERRSPLRPE